MSILKVNALQDTSGNGFYPARAWVNFKGTGTVSIYDDGNVSSITDLGTGRYQVNYSASLSTGNPAPVTTANYANAGASVWADAYSLSSSSFRTLVKSDANQTLDAYALYAVATA
jgi:hypothetical protein